MSQLTRCELHSTGEPDRDPVRPGIPVTDILTGFNSAQALLAALISKFKTGKGMYIDVSMFDTQVRGSVQDHSSYR